jgi:tol-pal system protein YbgF
MRHHVHSRAWSSAGVAVAVWGALAAGAAPAVAANREHQQMMAEVRMLQEQNQQLQLALASLTETLKTMNARLDAQAEAGRKAAADQRLLAEGLAADLRVVREKIDDTTVRLASLAQEVDSLRATVPIAAPVSAPSSPDASPAAPADAGAPAAPPPAPAPNPAAGLSPQRLWEQAYADYASGQWSLAITGFETFLRTFPRSEQADKAQRYIGESHSLDGKFDQAIAAYNKVITNYPTSPEVPLAYYKRGLAQVRLGQNDRARESWETVVKMFPDSDAALLAKQGLDRLARTPR